MPIDEKTGLFHYDEHEVSGYVDTYEGQKRFEWRFCPFCGIENPREANQRGERCSGFYC